MSLEDINSSSQADGQELQTSELEPNTEILSENIEKPSTELESASEIIESDENKELAETFKGIDFDQKLYDEVLEKLDIKPKAKVNDAKEGQEVQEKFTQEKTQNLEKSQVAIQVEKSIAQDFTKIQKLMQTGLINSVQGQNLKKQVLKKAFDKLVQTEKIRRTLPPALNPAQSLNKQIADKSEVFEEFSKSNPEFFTSDGRKEVLNYLKSDGVIIGKDELSKISGIIRTVEKAAIDRYLKKVTHEKTLRDSNEVAKQRLTANAQKSSSSGNLSRTFTREQIGKMSSAEFAKYEASIMENLKKGLIR